MGGGKTIGNDERAHAGGQALRAGVVAGDGVGVVIVGDELDM
jgi:hypothetical protein